MPRDKDLGQCGGRTAYFRYEGRRWRLNADSKVDRVMRADECLKLGEDPFIVESTRREGSPCLDLIPRLNTDTAKGFYELLGS